MCSVTKTNPGENYLTHSHTETNHSQLTESVPAPQPSNAKSDSLKSRIIESIETTGNNLIGIADKIYGSIAYVLRMTPPPSKKPQ